MTFAYARAIRQHLFPKPVVLFVLMIALLGSTSISSIVIQPIVIGALALTVPSVATAEVARVCGPLSRA